MPLDPKLIEQFKDSLVAVQRATSEASMLYDMIEKEASVEELNELMIEKDKVNV